MDLGHAGDETSLEALDDVDFPQRPGAVEGLAEHVGGVARQLGRVAGRWQGTPVQVMVDVEVGILDPPGVVEAPRYRYEPPAKRRQEVQALQDDPAQSLVGRGRPRRGGRRIDDGDRAHLEQVGRRFQRKEHRVNATEPLHVHLLLRQEPPDPVARAVVRAQMPRANGSGNRESLAFVLQATQATDDLLDTEVVAPTEARGEGVKTRRSRGCAATPVRHSVAPGGPG